MDASRAIGRAGYVWLLQMLADPNERARYEKWRAENTNTNGGNHGRTDRVPQRIAF